MIKQTYDILIAGNGILGLSVAYALALENPFLKIGIVGPANRKGSATLAAGAMLNCFAEVHKLSFKSKYSTDKFLIAREALKLWPSWVAQINTQVSPLEKISINPGTFVILNSKAGKREDENYNTILQTAKRYQEVYEEVEPRDIPGFKPIDDSRPLKAVYLPNEGSVNPHQLLTALEKAASLLANVNFIDDIVTDVLIDNNKVTGLKTAVNGILHASQVLLATGAYTQKLIEKIPALKNRIPKVFSSAGTSLILKMKDHQFQHVVRTPLRTGACGVHIMPCHQKVDKLYLGASSSIRVMPKIKAKTRDLYFLIENSIEQFNHQLRDAEIVRYRVGNRPVTFDTFPLIGKTSIASLWVLTGTYRDGLHDSPLLAASIAQEMLGRPPLIAHEFQPERFPIELMTKEETINELVDQYISAGYEHAMRLPKICWMQDVHTMVRSLVVSMYDELEIDMGLAPDIFIMLHYTPDLIPIFREYYKMWKREFSTTGQKTYACA